MVKEIPMSPKSRSHKTDNANHVWEIKQLGEVCEILNGGTPKTGIPEYWDGEINWITPADLGKLKVPTVNETPRKITKLGLEKSSAKLFPENSVILSTRAPIGHLAINMVPMSTNQGCRGLVPGENIDTWFLYYFLKMNVELLESLGTGATFKELSTKALAGIKIPLPPLLEQQRIVAILDEAFAAIAKAKANAEQNLKNAKELFESYLKGIFEAKGDGWEEKQLGEVCDFKGGGTPSTKRKEYWGGEIPWVSPKDMKFRSIYSSEDNITELAVEQSSTSIIPSGSVLIVVRSGILSRIVPLGITIKDVTINQDLKALIPKSILSGEFLLYFLEASMKTLLSQVTRGATVHRLSTDSLKDIQISFPAISKQESIVCQLDRLRAETKKLETIYQNKIADLEELKKSILQKAFAGELKTDKPMAVCE